MKQTKEEKYLVLKDWGLGGNKGKIVTMVESINPWEFRGYFEGQKGFNFVFQYKDVKKLNWEVWMKIIKIGKNKVLSLLHEFEADAIYERKRMPIDSKEWWKFEGQKIAYSRIIPIIDREIET